MYVYVPSLPNLPLIPYPKKQILIMIQEMIIYTLYVCIHLSGGSDGIESARNAGNRGPIPGLGRHPGEGNYETVQYFCLENFMDRGAWQVTSMGSQKAGRD